MNDIRSTIQEVIREYITISKTDIERALEDLDLASMVDSAIKNALPYALSDIVESVIDETVEDAIQDALS